MMGNEASLPQSPLNTFLPSCKFAHPIPINPANAYIAWTLPETLFPLINAKKQQEILPILNFTVSPSQPKAHFHGSEKYARNPDDSTVDRVAVEEPLNEADFLLFDNDRKPNDASDKPKTRKRELTLNELWCRYQGALDRVQGVSDASNGAEKFFDWLDAMTKRGQLEKRVYDNLKMHLESKLRCRLEWARRKLMMPEYRNPLGKILSVIPPANVTSFPEAPNAVRRALKERNCEARERVVFDKMLVLAETRFDRFPSLINRIHSEKMKHALRKLANDMHKKRTHLDGGQTKSDIGGLAHSRVSLRMKFSKSSVEDSNTSDNGLDSKNTRKKRKKAGKKGKKTARKIGKRKSGKKKALEEEESNEDDSDDDDVVSSDMGSGEKCSQADIQALKKRKKEKEGHSGVADKVIDWTVRPVPAKLALHDHYTKNEIELLHKHARKSYNFKVDVPEPTDIAAPDPAMGEGPILPSPVLVRLLAEATYNKRWRLTDMFFFGDMNKTWRLDPDKVRFMCAKLGLDSGLVSDVAIKDFFVELDDSSEQRITYKDLQRGIKSLIKERRVRKRYCMALVAGPTAMPEKPKALPVGKSNNPELKIEIIEPIDEDEEDTSAPSQAGKLTPVRQYIQSQNKQPLQPPLEVGTDVCDEGGAACQWHSVFSEELMLAWRIQQKLARLYQDSRWLEVKTAVRVFGPMRTVEHDMATVDDLAPKTVPAPAPAVITKKMNIPHFADIRSNATLEELANLSHKEETHSHEDMHERLSFAGTGVKSLYLLRKAFPMITAATGSYRTAAVSHSGKRRAENGSRRKEHTGPPRREEAVPLPFHDQLSHPSDVDAVPKDDHSSYTCELDPAEMQPPTAVSSLRKIYSKRSIVAREKRDARTDLDRFLRRRFRAMHNQVPINPNPTELLEILQTRAIKILEETAKEEEDRLRAVLDPQRHTEPTRTLVNEVSAVLTVAHQQIQAALVISADPVGNEELRRNYANRKAAVRNTLLLETRGLLPAPSTLDSRTKAIMYQAKRLKSSLHLPDTDIRSCSRSMSSVGSSISMASSAHKRLDVAAVCANKAKLPQVAPVLPAVTNSPSTATPIGSGEAAPPKHLNHRDLLDNTSGRVNVLLDSFLSQERDHLMRGLTKTLKIQARQLEISKFQPVEVLERRLVQKARMARYSDNYFNSIRRDLWSDFRRMKKKIQQKEIPELFSDDFLRKVLLRPEDFNHEIMPYEEALAQFKRVMIQQFGGKFPARKHKRWSKQFRSLPAFFPLGAGADLMKNIEGTEGAAVA